MEAMGVEIRGEAYCRSHSGLWLRLTFRFYVFHFHIIRLKLIVLFSNLYH